MQFSGGGILPGHERCPAEYISIKTLCGGEALVRPVCLHDHTEPVYALDAYGPCLDYHVADYCLSCGRMLRKPEFK